MTLNRNRYKQQPTTTFMKKLDSKKKKTEKYISDGNIFFFHLISLYFDDDCLVCFVYCIVWWNNNNNSVYRWNPWRHTFFSFCFLLFVWFFSPTHHIQFIYNGQFDSVLLTYIIYTSTKKTFVLISTNVCWIEKKLNHLHQKLKCWKKGRLFFTDTNKQTKMGE